MVEAFDAVTVPSFLKAGRAFAAGRGLVCGSSSAVTSMSPFFDAMTTGSTSSAKRPSARAARERR